MAAVTPKGLAPSLRVAGLALALGAAAAATYLTWLRYWTRSVEPSHFPVLALAGAFALFEIFVVHLEYRERPAPCRCPSWRWWPGLIFYPPAGLLVARLVGSLAGLWCCTAASGTSSCCSTSASFALEATVATVVYRAVLGLSHGLSAVGRRWPPSPRC